MKQPKIVNKSIKEMWCLVDSVGPTYKDYLEDLSEADVYLIIMQENPTTLSTISKLNSQKCKVTLVFEQTSKKLVKKYENRLCDYSLAVIMETDPYFPTRFYKKFDKIIFDSDTMYLQSLTNITDKELMFINHIPFRPFMGVKLDRKRLRELRVENTLRVSDYVNHIYDLEMDNILLNSSHTLKVDLSTDRLEGFESDDQCIKTYSFTDYLEERKEYERKTNIHKRLPKTAATKNTRGKSSKS